MWLETEGFTRVGEWTRVTRIDTSWYLNVSDKGFILVGETDSVVGILKLIIDYFIF